MTRLIATELSKQLGQSVIVEDRPGASGVVGTEVIARATPDGYTIGQGNFSSMNTNRILTAKLPYNPDKDIQAIVFSYMSRNILAVNPAFPDLPTVSEAGVPGFEVAPWAGFVAPAGVPKPILAQLNSEINKALNVPAVRDKLVEMGLDPRGGTPEEFADFIRKEVAKWTDVAKRANVRAD